MHPARHAHPPSIRSRRALVGLGLGAMLAAAGCTSEGRDPDCPSLPEDPSAEEIAEFRAAAEAKKCVTPLDGDFVPGSGGGGGSASGLAGGGATSEGP